MTFSLPAAQVSYLLFYKKYIIRKNNLLSTSFIKHSSLFFYLVVFYVTVLISRP
jgi:hypothetical protein